MSLKNAEFTLDAPPEGFKMTTFIGPEVGDIASDTALQGDFDGDGFPEFVDLRDGNEPDASEIRLTEIQGVKAEDVLCYSAPSSDHDGDGIDDLVVNEMLGDGLQPGTQDAGNLIVICGKLVEGLY
ncbi:MAG TPA: hypothetical protein EYG46_05745 [Myxococcales bacterium]|nr:hypothetical protein [Myxococcales bacterium]HIM00481.1 hypothetical protein [Myxococcales bacterium]